MGVRFIPATDHFAQRQVLVYGKDGASRLKWIGAILVILGCGGIGLGLVRQYCHEARTLRELKKALSIIYSELECRLTPLPNAFLVAAQSVKNPIRGVLLWAEQEMNAQENANALTCMERAVKNASDLPPSAAEILLQLSGTLGIFDLNGQLNELRSAEMVCHRLLEEKLSHENERTKMYQTLGLCAGILLAILLL